MQLDTINTAALTEALLYVGGEELLEDVTASYKLIDEAQFKGYQQGQQDLYNSAAPVIEAALKATEAAAREAGWKDGYVDGVARARTAPAFADQVVESIIDAQDLAVAQKAYEEFNGEDTMPLPEFYEGDSGDETACDAPHCGCFFPEDCPEFTDTVNPIVSGQTDRT